MHGAPGRAPIVSVVMPAYNAGRYIREAIDSVLSQNFRDLELIVVDDGSTDETAAIVRGVAGVDPRVRLIRQPNSGKPAVARNRGIRESRGEILCFLDADDVWRPGRLSVCLGLLDKRADVDLVFHDVEYWSAEGDFLGRYCLGDLDFTQQVLADSRKIDDHSYLCDRNALFFFMCMRVTTIYTSAATIRRTRLLQEPICFAEDVVTGEDADLWFRIVRTSNVVYVDRVLSGYRLHDESITHQSHLNPTDTQIVHVRNYRRFGRALSNRQRWAYRRRIANGFFTLGCNYVKAGQHRLGVDFYVHSLLWLPSYKAIKGLAKVGITICLSAIAKKPRS